MVCKAVAILFCLSKSHKIPTCLEFCPRNHCEGLNPRRRSYSCLVVAHISIISSVFRDGVLYIFYHVSQNSVGDFNQSKLPMGLSSCQK